MQLISEIFRKKKKVFFPPQQKKLLVIFLRNLITWGAQGQMTQINLIVNSLPRDLSEFIFFVIVGYTAGTAGII